MNPSRICLVFALAVGCCAQTAAQSKVSELKSHNLQDYCWMRLAEVVPEVTDRAILAIGTVEAHGAVAVGADNIIPQHLAELVEVVGAIRQPPNQPLSRGLVRFHPPVPPASDWTPFNLWRRPRR